MRRCPSCGEENSDRARFCQACATPLSAAEPSGDVRKVVTIVFCDVTGSTALGERLDPEALRRVMNRYFDLMAEVIERHGGTVEKFIGDAVMAVFGIPRLHEDDALRAVRAAAGMQEALATLSAELEREHDAGLQARIGVNTGEVVSGDPSGGQRLVTGDAVNVAARLEQAAPPGAVLLGEPTFRLVKDAVRVEPVEPLELKGKAESVPAHLLVEVLEDVAGHARHLDSPIVGRSKELALFGQAIERATSERTSHLFTLLGPAGVGKSRLVHEFLTGAAAGARVLRGRCLSYGEGITFFPLAEVVHQASGSVDSDPPAAALGKLVALVAGLDDAERIATLVAGLVGLGAPSSTEDAFWGVRKLFEHLAVDRPLVVVFDDIHWAEPTFLDLIDHLADWTRDAAVLLVCVARPELLELRPGWGGGKLNATSILLEPLAGDEASALVDNLLGRARIPDLARDRILEAAEGNPLFVEEMLGMLIDDGLLRREGDTWVATEDLAQASIPPTIQLLLAARLDRLDGEERAVIERGSVEGKVFHIGAVSTLAPESVRPHVRSRLLALARKELIRPDRAEFAGEDAFRFRHLLIRDAAYRSMPKEQRADLHERFADWLADVAGGRAAEYDEILGHHLEQAVRYRTELGASDEDTAPVRRRAAELLHAAADRANHRGDVPAAVGLAERAAELARGTDLASRSGLLLADVVLANGDFARAVDESARARELAAAAGDRRIELLASLIHAESRGQTAATVGFAEERIEVERIERELAGLGDEEGRRSAEIVLGRLAFFEGRAEESQRVAEHVLEHPEGLRPRERTMLAHSIVANGYFGGEPVERTLARIPRSLEVLADSIAGEAVLLRVRGALLGMQGRLEESLADLERGERMLEDVGGMRGIMSSQIAGEAALRRGDAATAERLFRRAHEHFNATGETGFNSTTAGLLAVALLELGRVDEAIEMTERSRSMTNEEDFASEAQWRIARALIDSTRGEHEEAERLAREAVGFTAPSDYLSMDGEAHETLGRVLVTAGRADEARAEFAAARERFERKGDVASTDRVGRRLAAL